MRMNQGCEAGTSPAPVHVWEHVITAQWGNAASGTWMVDDCVCVCVCVCVCECVCTPGRWSEGGWFLFSGGPKTLSS